MCRLVALDIHIPWHGSSSRTATYLFEQLIGCLLRAEITHFKRRIGIQYTHEHKLGKVKTFCNHLRTHKYGRTMGIKAFKQLLVCRALACRIRIHPHDRARIAKHALKLKLYTFGTHANTSHKWTRAGGAPGKWIGVCAHRP